MSAIFNQGVYHGFEVSSDGKLIERWGNPPTEFNVVASGFKPNTPTSVSRIVYDPANGFYVSYFVEGLAANGNDVIVWVWTGSGWQGPYGG